MGEENPYVRSIYGPQNVFNHTRWHVSGSINYDKTNANVQPPHSLLKIRTDIWPMVSTDDQLAPLPQPSSSQQVNKICMSYLKTSHIQFSTKTEDKYKDQWELILSMPNYYGKTAYEKL